MNRFSGGHFSRTTLRLAIRMMMAVALAAFGMARRANLNAEEKARIMDYIAAAQAVVERGGLK